MFKIPLKRPKRQILHIDADAFFASVEQVLDPRLRGKAVLVGGPRKDRGIVSACSYEAKKFGIHSGMPMYLATRRCPNGVVVNGHFDAYRDFSKRMYEVFCRYTPDVEMASIDEAYLDITGCELMYKCEPDMIAKNILMTVYKKLGISVSCGLSTSKTVAKVASSTNKPHKLTVVPVGGEEKFLAALELRAMPGVGPKTYAMLDRYGFETIGDIAKQKVADLVDKFGIGIIPLWKRCRGVDHSPVVSVSPPPKSISKENTFYTEVHSEKICIDTLKELSVVVLRKLRAHKLKAKTVVLRVRYKNAEGEGRGIFEDFSFQSPLAVPSCCDGDIFPVVRKLFKENVDLEESVRLVGIGVTNLVEVYNLNLFGSDERKDELLRALDGYAM